MTQTDDASRRTITSLAVSGIGVLLLLLGCVSAFLGPVEMYCFYLFSEGGRFYYPGFGFGSFMFANITWQIIGYYLIALICIPLGYAHLRQRSWARPLSIALLWAWLIVGIPLLPLVLFILFSSKDLSPMAAIIALIFFGASYVILPGLLIRFYRSSHVRQVFADNPGESCWIERQPIPILTLGILYLFYALVLHVPIFFRGIFPVFGTFVFNIEGIVLVDCAVLCLLAITWGTLTRQVWAWWAGIVYFSLLAVSTIVSLVRTEYLALLAKMEFPAREVDILDGVPLQGWHGALLIGLPLVLTLIAIMRARREFSRESAPPHGE